MAGYFAEVVHAFAYVLRYEVGGYAHCQSVCYSIDGVEGEHECLVVSGVGYDYIVIVGGG